MLGPGVLGKRAAGARLTIRFLGSFIRSSELDTITMEAGCNSGFLK
jgi:hypothetical protein